MSTLWRARIYSTTSVAVFCLMVVGLVSVGCGDDPVRAENYPPSLTSIGPIEKEGEQVIVDFSLRDAEGDDVAVRARLCEATEEGGASETCFAMAEGTASDRISYLPTTPKGTDVPHRFAWAVGCGISDGECQAPATGTEFVIQLATDEGDARITSAVFTLGDIGFGEIPGCDAPDDPVMSRPSACQ